MISIQSAMLVALGFLVASLLGLLVASAFWSRAVRLTTQRIKQAMPVSEAEVKADRDRLRAEYAIQVHKLETNLEQAKFERARHLIEINRRDASISVLETDMAQFKVSLEENLNARRVLEQTVADRLPKVEARLAEAKRLLFNRDREIAELVQGARKHKLALEEVASTTAQKNAQIDHLTTTLTTRGGRRRGSGDTPADGEVEALRTKTREQATLIDRLQRRLDHGYVLPSPTANGSSQLAAAEGDLAGLRRDLAEAETASASGPAAATGEEDASRAVLDRELRALKAKAEDQAGEIARLRASLATFESGSTGGILKDNKIVLKARLGSAQAQAEQQAETIGKLRSELAAVHERLARQAAHFMDEMRRMGTGSVPTSGQARRPRNAERRSLADRVGQMRPTLAPVEPAKSEPVKEAGPTPPAKPDPEAAPANGHEGGNGAAAAPVNPAENTPSPPRAAQLPKEPEIPEGRQRPRLLDRITALSKG